MWTEADYIAANDQADDWSAVGRIELAQAILEVAVKAADAAEEDAFALFFRARLAWVRGEHTRMLALLQDANELKPNCSLIMRNIGLALDLEGRHADALLWYDRSLSVEPNDYRAHCNRGVALAQLKKYGEAMQCFQKSLDICPGYPRALRNHGVVLALLAHQIAESGLPYPTQEPGADAYDRVLSPLAGDLLWHSEGVPNRQSGGVPLPNPRSVARFTGTRVVPVGPDRQVEGDVAPDSMSPARQTREDSIRLEVWRRLSARWAHRIGNQVFASQGALRQLRRFRGRQSKPAVADLEACVNRIRNVILEFRRFSRYEQPRLVSADVCPLIMDVVRRYAGLATKVRLWANVTEKVLTCLLDRDQIDQALGELLENAIHHTPAHGEIRVTAAPVALPAGMRVRITVQDTGPGVPNEDKERIFEPFFSKRPGGSGLGLAIVRQIVENHRGTIRETGGANQGARFEIELPAHTKQEMSP